MSDYVKLYENLKLSKEILDSLNIKWCLTWGSLLGAVREQDFIQNGKEDLDIFLICVDRKDYNEIINEFLRKKFTCRHARSNPGAFFRGWAMVDLYRIGFGKKYGPCYCFKQYPFPAKFFETLKVGKIKDVECPIPNHAEELINILYGEDWRIPKRMRVPLSSLEQKLVNINKENNE